MIKGVQALAEDEAAFAAISEVSLPRQDSAHELDETLSPVRHPSSTGKGCQSTFCPISGISAAQDVFIMAQDDRIHICVTILHGL